MINIAKGIIAGLAASALVFAAVYLLAAAGVRFPPDPMLMTSGIKLYPVGLSWSLHFVVGAMFSGALSPLPLGPFWLKGLLFGLAAWLLTAAIVWALEPTAAVPLAVGPAMLHLLFGCLLGLTYGTLLDAGERRERLR